MEKFEEILKSCEAKVTPARLAILGVLDKANKHLSIDEIYKRAKKEVPNLGIATTYRTVKLLCDFDLLIKHNFEDCEALYEKKGAKKKHSHIIDINTKDVSEFESDKIKKLLKEIATTKGYELVDYKVEIYAELKK